MLIIDKNAERQNKDPGEVESRVTSLGWVLLNQPKG